VVGGVDALEDGVGAFLRGVGVGGAGGGRRAGGEREDETKAEAEQPRAGGAANARTKEHGGSVGGAQASPNKKARPCRGRAGARRGPVSVR
jgi:hypothetical protein